MNVLIAGAHGGVGQHITEILAESDHDATAMVRTESQVDEMADFGVETAVADLTEDVSHAVPGHDAIVFAAGSSGADVEGVDRDGANKLVDAAEAEGVDRFVMLSAMNADEPENSPDGLYDYLVAKQAADEYLQSSDLTYTIVRPGALTDDPATGRVKTARKLDRGEITRADVAHVLVAALDTESTHGTTFELLEGEESIEDALANPTDES
ncbi:SDR family oxidoreductase [Halococcus hamelinensis]|uniref:NAD(P)-binding domain-containing protein n=1 Tax=Halococcus hamelinensis 100A6 TaxID=1132509 RepID=M0LTG5_9EURY|nr:SDR family oxidoreductase [Halococcus hamelinensis]EMA35689.1 hypothetical protein C447_16064 [Halococcus hamelinensis 100A6]